MNERKKAMQESLVQATSGASQTGLRSPEQGSKHTPTPWTVNSGAVDCLGFFWIDGDYDTVSVCDLYVRSPSGSLYCKENAESNAARIVQCVNSHDDLVAALEGYLNASTFDDLAPAHDAARAALLKAKGGA